MHARRRRVFAFAALLLSLALVEASARIIEWGAAHLRVGGEAANPYVRFRNRVPVFERAPAGGGEVFRRTRHHWIHPDQSFLAHKPAGGIRIFALGGSAAQGWPHPAEWSYPAILERRLSRLYPNRSVEVLNVAGNTYASYRVEVVFEEILRYEPDLILVYSGNNEFLEDFLYGVHRLPFPWRHSALVRLLAGAVWGRTDPHVVDVEGYGVEDQVANRLSFAFGRASARRSDPDQLRTVVDHYRFNIESMLASARDAGVPVMLLDVPVNLKEWRPNVSIQRGDLGEAERARFDAGFRKGLLAIEAGDYEAAQGPLLAAIAVDDGHAEAHYLRGIALHRLGSPQEARLHFERALERDAYPFRSLPQLDAVRRALAERYGVPLVEVVRRLEERTLDGMLGLESLVNYVHPTVASNDVIAEAVLEAMDRARLLPEPRALPVARSRVAVPANAGEGLGVLLGLYSQFLVMRQYEGLDALSQRILRSLEGGGVGGAGSRRYSAAGVRQFLGHTTPILQDYRRLLRAEKLGIVEQELSESEARGARADYVEMIRRLEALHLEPEEFLEWVPEGAAR